MASVASADLRGLGLVLGPAGLGLARDAQQDAAGDAEGRAGLPSTTGDEDK